MTYEEKEQMTRERNLFLCRSLSACNSVEEKMQWLCQAYHAHEDTLDHLQETVAELRTLLLANTHRPLRVREAQLCNVCRVCRGPVTCGSDVGAFILGYGAEFAHERCLDALKAAPAGTSRHQITTEGV